MTNPTPVTRNPIGRSVKYEMVRPVQTVTSPSTMDTTIVLAAILRQGGDAFEDIVGYGLAGTSRLAGGMDFFDAVVRLDQIAAVIVRVR